MNLETFNTDWYINKKDLSFHKTKPILVFSEGIIFKDQRLMDEKIPSVDMG
jgi:hypothetical protein